jgi:phosphinothricin acetyltransferase
MAVPLIREADASRDAQAVSAVYAEGVEDRIATFRPEPAPVEEVAGWIADSGRRPFLIAEVDGRAVGFAMVSSYSDFPPYACVGEYVIYIARSQRRQGIGRQLLDALCAESEARGFYKLVGKLFADNTASIELAHHCGFRDVGTHARHGRLDGEWKDVLIVERLLGDAAG